MLEALPRPTQSLFIAMKLLRAQPGLLFARLIGDAMLTGLAVEARSRLAHGSSWRIAIVGLIYVWLARAIVNAGFLSALAARWQGMPAHFLEHGFGRALRAIAAQLATSSWVMLVLGTQALFLGVMWRAGHLTPFAIAVAVTAWVLCTALQAWFTLRLWLAGNASIVDDQTLTSSYAETVEVLELRRAQPRFAVTAWLAITLTAVGELIAWLSIAQGDVEDPSFFVLLAPVMGAYVTALAQTIAVVVLGCLRKTVRVGRALVVSASPI